jgi:transcription elongation factor Elf1
MKEDRLIYLLESLLGKSKSARGGDEAVFSCPNCNHHKKKLTLNKLTQKYQCWVCGFKGARAIQLLKFIKAPYTAFQELKEIDAQYNFKTAHVEKPKDQLQLPEGFTTLLKGKGLIRDKAYHYLKSRGITAQDVVKYNIGYIEEGKLANFIIIPSYDRHGTLNKLTTSTSFRQHQKILLALTCFVTLIFLLSFVKVPLMQSQSSEMPCPCLENESASHSIKNSLEDE